MTTNYLPVSSVIIPCLLKKSDFWGSHKILFVCPSVCPILELLKEELEILEMRGKNEIIEEVVVMYTYNLLLLFVVVITTYYINNEIQV